MTEKELSELYTRLALQFDSVLGTLVSKNLVFTDSVPGIRKDFYDSLNEEKRKDFERILTYTQIIRRYIRENANNGPISLTQLAKQYSEESPGYMIQSWMRSRNTLEFLRQWEVAENPDFDDAACKELMQQARSSSLTITPSLWVKRTHAIGMTVKQGKGGGVTTHSDIRVEFDAIKLLFLKLKRLYNTTTLILESVQRIEAVYGSEFNTQKSLYTKILSEKLEFGWEDHTNI